MKITLKQLNNGFQPLQAIAANELPAKLAYKLGRIVAACNSEMESYRKAITALIKKYGEGDEIKGYKVEPETEAMVDFQREVEDLLNLEVEFWGDPIALAEIEPHAKLKASDLAWLDWLITDGEGESEKPKKPKLRAVKNEAA